MTTASVAALTEAVVNRGDHKEGIKQIIWRTMLVMYEIYHKSVRILCYLVNSFDGCDHQKSMT